ncbi:MAG: restriction endonuclease subunit M [Parabacteroides sp.]|nr:restriction endonuclease subunit M [Parabacteroides sp.]
MTDRNKVDIKENDVLRYDRQLLTILLKDNSSKKNIIWGTDNYAASGPEYAADEQITIPLISGKNGNIIKPRVEKNKKEQIARVRDKAEVFTPSWICNKQNNLVDKAWFEAEDIFNIELVNGWTTQTRPIPFPLKAGKTWQDYVLEERLEVSCGEAPYLVSRYDTITGDPIPTKDRIGLLDRKLRIIVENTNDEGDWYRWAKTAVQSVYGYEWQGDNLLLARENILYSFADYYQDKFKRKPSKDYMLEIANIISWNIWQMDGLKGVVPNSCRDLKVTSYNLFETEKEIVPCEGCLKNNIYKHNGIYCKIKDWKTGGTLKYVSLLKGGNYGK